MTAYEAVGTTGTDHLILAALVLVVLAAWGWSWRHTLVVAVRRRRRVARDRRDLHRAALVRDAQRAAADRMGAGTWGTGQ